MNFDDERDHAEEAANAAAMREENDANDVEVRVIRVEKDRNLGRVTTDGLEVNVYWFTDSDGETRIVVDVLTGELRPLRFPVRIYVNDDNGIAPILVDHDGAVTA